MKRSDRFRTKSNGESLFASSLPGLRKLVAETRSVYKMAGLRTSILFGCRALIKFRQVASDRSLTCVDWGMANRRYRIRCHGTTFEIDGAWFGVAREIYGRQTYFAPCGFTIREGQTVIDLGANVGLFSLLAARLGARVIAVEAQSEFLPILHENLRENDCAVNVIHGLIGERSGLASLPGKLEASSHYRAKPGIVSLNQIMARFCLHNIDFLKIDIEGSEFDLFSSNLEWLQHTSQIAMEVHESFGNPDFIAEKLAEARFKVQLCDAQLKNVNSLKGLNGFVYAWR